MNIINLSEFTFLKWFVVYYFCLIYLHLIYGIWLNIFRVFALQRKQNYCYALKYFSEWTIRLNSLIFCLHQANRWIKPLLKNSINVVVLQEFINYARANNSCECYWQSYRHPLHEIVLFRSSEPNKGWIARGSWTDKRFRPILCVRVYVRTLWNMRESVTLLTMGISLILANLCFYFVGGRGF